MMSKPGRGDVDDPMNEAMSSTGLLLMFAAVIGFVMGLAVFGMGSSGFATLVLVAALASFCASLVCFMADAQREDAADAALPFPSMLRR
jgi:hypothetical protein